MADISLSEALNMFVSGAKDFALTNAINNAQEQVQQIKMSGINDSEQRRALGTVAQSLVMRMSALGANAATVQQVSNSIMPQVPNSPDAAILQGLYTGNQGLVEAGQAAQDSANRSRISQIQMEEAVKARAQSRSFEQQSKLQDERLAAQERIAEMKASAAERKEAQKSAVAIESNAAVAQRSLTDLEKTVKKYGNYESNSTFNPFSNKEAAATLSQAGLDFAIAYAKIVDPNSVAREGEVATAQKYAIPMGYGISNETTLEAIKRMKKDIAQRLADNRALRPGGGVGSSLNSEPNPAKIGSRAAAYFE